ncbi:MAG: hypothetical protein KBT34_05370 [Prevotella sp.]|nr:hypothetical protein [Candidatus Prevotella equi]
MAKKVTIENIEQIFSLVKAESERLSKENENLKKIIEDNEKVTAAALTDLDKRVKAWEDALAILH